MPISSAAGRQARNSANTTASDKWPRAPLNQNHNHPAANNQQQLTSGRPSKAASDVAELLKTRQQSSECIGASSKAKLKHSSGSNLRQKRISKASPIKRLVVGPNNFEQRRATEVKAHITARTLLSSTPAKILSQSTGGNCDDKNNGNRIKKDSEKKQAMNSLAGQLVVTGKQPLSMPAEANNKKSKDSDSSSGAIMAGYSSSSSNANLSSTINISHKGTTSARDSTHQHQHHPTNLVHGHKQTAPLSAANNKGAATSKSYLSVLGAGAGINSGISFYPQKQQSQASLIGSGTGGLSSSNSINSRTGSQLHTMSSQSSSLNNPQTASSLNIKQSVSLKYIKGIIIALLGLDLMLTVFVHQFSSHDEISLGGAGSWLNHTTGALKLRLSLLNLVLSSVWFVVLIGAILFDVYFLLLLGCLVDIISFFFLLGFSIVHFTNRIDYNSVNLTSLLALLFSIVVLHVYLLVMAALITYLMLAVKRRKRSSRL